MWNFIPYDSRKMRWVFWIQLVNWTKLSLWKLNQIVNSFCAICLKKSYYWNLVWNVVVIKILFQRRRQIVFSFNSWILQRNFNRSSNCTSRIGTSREQIPCLLAYLWFTPTFGLHVAISVWEISVTGSKTSYDSNYDLSRPWYEQSKLGTGCSRIFRVQEN